MPTIYDVKAPDGSILEVEGPDNATDEQITAFAAQQFGPTGSAGASPIPVRAVDVPASEVPDASAFMIPATISKGIVKGAASIPDLLARGLGYGVGSIADVLGAPEEVVQDLKNPFTIGGALDVLQPTARNQKGFERIGEGVGGALTHQW